MSLLCRLVGQLHSKSNTITDIKKILSNYFWGQQIGNQQVITKPKQAMGATSWLSMEKFLGYGGWGWPGSSVALLGYGSGV